MQKKSKNTKRMEKGLANIRKSEIRNFKGLTKPRGSSKRKTTDEQLHEAGEVAFGILEKKFK